ncbi:TPA: hypothetical protein IAB29_00675 [Candidatus Ventrenecus stercoripullorum]|nr:hypothetical protein [Candidatus Ventrenecus stercoripullorum]
MKPRIPGNNPLMETRKESEETVNKQLRYQQIIEILTESKEPLSAKEIAVEMYKKHYVPTSERNFSAPRITELLNQGIVDCVGKKVCEYTHKSVGVFELCKK